MAFVRTPTGQKNQGLFYAEKAVVWIEGKSDRTPYAELLKELPVTFKRMGGRERAASLISLLKSDESPFVVIRDGDYLMLSRKRSPHRRAVMLARYSIENYLAERDLAQAVCMAYAEHDEAELRRDFERHEERLRQNLYGLVVLDIAHQSEGTGEAVLPNHINAVLRDSRSLEFDTARIAELETRLTPLVSVPALEIAKTRLDAYLSTRPFRHVLRGHLLMSWLKQFMYVHISSNDVHFNPDMTTLYVLLTRHAWSPPPSDDHKLLRSKVRRAAKEALRLRNALVQSAAP